MKPSKIRYKGFEWEHNPETLSVIKEENLSENKLPFGNSFVRKNSSKCRVVKGKGKLVGYDCLNQFNALLKLQREGGSGILSLPQIKPFYAYFKKLELLCEPTQDMVTYSFEFLEDSEKNYTIGEPVYHMVLASETLWDIAYMYKTDISVLINLNPWVKRVDELGVGRRVRVC